eukprot:CAMPEP_0113851514 /NCGR_PEP_ID=MMETSP0372-20130328/4711_1 /TAXON_ID=340204 /ORGANISM="Lankesteria abbotti" /LENGTH=152 /DNA_ID=CAMNT_0000822389 /DNA_START=718 /DNA_END=1173 /DNA_ORIENTATION=- /assembly_acc=CAM_ASM_000359
MKVDESDAFLELELRSVTLSLSEVERALDAQVDDCKRLTNNNDSFVVDSIDSVLVRFEVHDPDGDMKTTGGDVLAEVHSQWKPLSENCQNGMFIKSNASNSLCCQNSRAKTTVCVFGEESKSRCHGRKGYGMDVTFLFGTTIRLGLLKGDHL